MESFQRSNTELVGAAEEDAEGIESFGGVRLQAKDSQCQWYLAESRTRWALNHPHGLR